MNRPARNELQRDRHMRYLWLLVVIAVCALLSIGAVNVAVDPYALVGSFAHRALPLDFAFEREIRFNLIASKRPATIFFGASQIAVGIDPSNPDVPDRHAFNAAIDGGTLTESIRLLREAVRVGSVRRVILGVSYNMTTHPEGDAFNELFLKGAGPARMAEAFVSTAMLRSSLKSLLDALMHKPLDMTDNGQLTAALMKRQLQGKGSVRAAFDTMSRPSTGDVGSFMDRLHTFISAACRANARVIVLLLPDHAANLELFAASGQWDALKLWKRDITAADASAPCPVRTVDFEDFNFVTTEPLPPKGSALGMKYYWDPGHFTPETGSLILSRVFRPDDAWRGRPFGVDLTPATIDGELRALDKERLAYERANRTEIAAIAAAAARP